MHKSSMVTASTKLYNSLISADEYAADSVTELNALVNCNCSRLTKHKDSCFQCLEQVFSTICICDAFCRLAALDNYWLRQEYTCIYFLEKHIFAVRPEY